MIRRTRRGYAGGLPSSTSGGNDTSGRGTILRGSRDRDSGRLQGCAPPEAGIERRDSAPADPLADQEMHRVGLASVQLTRSTSAEAIAGRESLQPSALRARCTRKPTGPFGRRQAPSRDNVSQIAIIAFCCTFPREFGSTQKRTEGGGSFVRPPNRPPPKRLPVGGPSTSGAPSSVHTGHYGPVIAPSSGYRSEIRTLRPFLFAQYELASDACALERNGP